MSPNPPSPPLIFHFDPHPVVRRGFAFLINAQSDLALAGGTGSPEELLPLLQSSRAEVLVAETGPWGVRGFSLLREVKTTFPSLRMACLSFQPAAVYAPIAIASGVSTYLHKSIPPDQLCTNLRRLACGQSVDTCSLPTAKPAELVRAFARLQPDDILFLELLNRHQSPREIAREMDLSPNSVSALGQRLRRHFSVSRQRDLVRLSARWFRHN